MVQKIWHDGNITRCRMARQIRYNSSIRDIAAKEIPSKWYKDMLQQQHNGYNSKQGYHDNGINDMARQMQHDSGITRGIKI